MAFFSARQPILDIEKRVFGYELLFRSSIENFFPDVDEEMATSKMIEGLQFDLGLDKISSGKLAFINFTEKSILNAYPNMLPKNQIVVEVLESVKPSKAVFVELQKLAIEGYIIALDDFIHSQQWEPFYSLCQIIKIDLCAINDEQLQDILNIKRKFPHIKLLAEKVETYDEFQKYKELGFELFQGYFFSKPEVIKSVSLTGSQSILTSLLSEITKPDPNFAQISKLFELDVALSFKLLRYTQSPIFRRRNKIENIKQAVILLGKNELERFIMLLFAAVFGEGKPPELIKLSIHRAKFCEQFAEQGNFSGELSSAFLVGMLSLLDAMLDSELEEPINKMPLSDNIKQALIKDKGRLADFVNICKSFESGDFAKMEAVSKEMDVEYTKMLEIYESAGEWAQERLSAML